MAGNLVTFRWQPPGDRPGAGRLSCSRAASPRAQPMVALGTGRRADRRRRGAGRVVLRALPHARRRRPEPGVERNPDPRRRAGAALAAGRPAGDQRRQLGAPGLDADLRRRRAGGYVLDVERLAGRVAATAQPRALVVRRGAVGHLHVVAACGERRRQQRAGHAGAAARFRAPAPASPGAPTNLLAYVAGGTTFVVWDPPVTGSAATSYVISVPGIGAHPAGPARDQRSAAAGQLRHQRAGGRAVRRERAGDAGVDRTVAARPASAALRTGTAASP